jgi:hypothetical protein
MTLSAESSTSPLQPPASVNLAVGLLCLQATIWTFVSAVLAYGSASVARAPQRSGTITGVVVFGVLALVVITIAAGKFWLAYRLPRGGHKTREAVITVEGLMGGFAVLVLLALFVIPIGLVLSPPVIIGGIMSLRVANGLTKPPARQYFDANEAAKAKTANLRSIDGGGAARFQARLASA